MTSTILIVVLIAVPLGFLVGQLFLNRPRAVVVRPSETAPASQPQAPPAPEDPWDSIMAPPSTEAMAGKIERLRAERNDLRQQLVDLTRERDDLQTQIDGSAAQLLASAKQVERAEDVSRSAGARLVEALAERDEAMERLQVEKAGHAETDRSLEGAENYLRLLIGHLDDGGTNLNQPDLSAQISELRDTVGRLGQQIRTNETTRVPAGRR